MEKRELLTKILELLKEKHEADEALNDFLKNSPLFFEANLTSSFRLDDMLVKSFVFLVKGKDDKELEDVVFWWMLEMEFGQQFEIGDLVYRDEAPDLSSIEKFVDFVMKG